MTIAKQLAAIFLLLSGCLACSGPHLAAPERPLPEAAAVTAAPLPTIPYAIQAGAFSTAERAEAYALRLQRRGVEAYYTIDEDGLFKVRFERFANREAALQRAEALAAEGLIGDFFIVRPLSGRPSADPAAELRAGLVQTARRFIGTPYRWSAASPEDGFDCSGLTMTVYRLNGLELPRTARAQFRMGRAVQRHELAAGDLLFFDTRRSGRVSHVGIYCGENRFIHAPSTGKKVSSASLTNGYFNRRYLGARRYF